MVAIIMVRGGVADGLPQDQLLVLAGHQGGYHHGGGGEDVGDEVALLWFLPGGGYPHDGGGGHVDGGGAPHKLLLLALGLWAGQWAYLGVGRVHGGLLSHWLAGLLGC